ncbi:UNVERIFIED_CONTAM: Cleft lip and palate transmembrane protein 1 [Sesamum radiatum]|uniref:Cleft lip and palate transmembrane protein 1 n=1 Tax=Sesamum radiatum TaxID=300843 RepID=A0AAW2RIL6_SESRA
MEPPATVGGGGGGGGGARRPQQQQQQQPGLGQMLTGIIRIAVFWYFASKFFGPKRSPTQSSHQISNLFHKGEPLDMWLYLSEQESFNDFGSERALVWQESNIPYAVWTADSSRTLSLKYYPSEDLKKNGSLYAHVFFARSGYPPDPKDPEYQPLAAFGRTHPVVTYLPKSKADKRKSLLGTSQDSDGERDSEVVKDAPLDDKEDGPVEWRSYWKPNITINLVDDFTRNHITLQYKVFTTVTLMLKLFLLFLWIPVACMCHFFLSELIDQSFQIHRSYGSMLEGEADELKRVFLEGNPYLLAVTMVVSVLHSIFDFLAFKNDIQFWNKNKSMEGLSAKSVVVNFFCQLIVFLYLLDNETSWMILASSGIGCCIEFWKIGKAMHIEIDRSGKIPMLRFRDRESYAKNKTKEYDDLAMKYLTYVLFFLAVCFSIYSLKYERHKSWYSWILSSLTSCVYMFGFIMMCPQLFINYKLKSVAHLPWRQMTYKFLNTIIDDLFAFVIKMPILHRLSVFRDDVIFLIYLYQRWIYPVDKKRVNEFGFGGEDDQALVGTDATEQNEAEKKTN